MRRWKSCVVYLTKKNKNSTRSPALASARIAPKICQSQLQTIYSEFRIFHPNPFTSGEVIAERVNIVETRHKVFPILGEASSASKNMISKRHSWSSVVRYYRSTDHAWLPVSIRSISPKWSSFGTRTPQSRPHLYPSPRPASPCVQYKHAHLYRSASDPGWMLTGQPATTSVSPASQP